MLFKPDVGNSPPILGTNLHFRHLLKKFQPAFVVGHFLELSEMSAWLGQRYHHLDEISSVLSNDDNILTLSKSVGDSFGKGGELPTAGPVSAFCARMIVFKSGISGSVDGFVPV